MGNEELAGLVKQGDAAAAGLLWEQNRGLLFARFRPYFQYCGKCGCEPDDLIQCGYFVILRAAAAYEPEKGLSFTTYLQRHLRNIAAETLGFRGKKRVETVSLSTPMHDEVDGLELGDTLADARAQDFIEDIESSDVCRIIKTEIDSLPDVLRNAANAYLFERRTLKSIAAETGVYPQTENQRRNKAMRELRKSKALRALRDEVIGTSAYHGTGLTAFRNSCQSVEERIVLYLESKAEGYSQVPAI
jgi:RNA polymerase sigma factor (sigma-70 family)